ncbi:hypothetical protein Tco_0436752 [Tanacetum coccineum]
MVSFRLFIHTSSPSYKQRSLKRKLDRYGLPLTAPFHTKLFGQDVRGLSQGHIVPYHGSTRKWQLEQRRISREQREEKVCTGVHQLDASLVDTKSSGTESEEQDTCSSSGNDAHADDADIRPIYDEEPMADGKPVLQPHRNQSVVRQPTAFKSEQPRISKPRFASQVDVNNDLSKPVTTHYLPKERESAVVKPHHMIASSESRNSSKNMPRFSSNDMVHNHYLEEAKKKTQECGRNSRPSVMPSAKSQSTTNGSKPKPRSNTQTSRNCPVSKNSFVMTKTVPIAEYSRNSRNFSDSKHFVCSTCQKCVFNANHDHCVTKFLNEVNSRAKVPSNKTTNRNKPVEKTSVAKKPERQISKGHRSSIKKTSIVHEKKMTPRSCLRWKPTSKIFKVVGLKWVPTGKIFTSSTTKVDSDPKNGSNEDITNQYECEQTLDVSAGTLNLSACTSFNPKKEGLRVCSELGIHDHSNKPSSSKLVSKVVPPADKTATSRQELELLFYHHITMLRYSIYTVKWPSQNRRYKRWCCSLIPAESDSLSHAHAQTTKTYYKHQDSSIKKTQVLKTKTSSYSDIKDNSLNTQASERL